MRSKKILITGGMGYVGSIVCRYLYDKGYKIIIVDNLCRSSISHSFYEEFYQIDLCDKKELSKVFEKHKIDKIVHLASNAYVQESVLFPDKYYNNNLISSINLLDLMVQFKIKEIVFSSTCSIFDSTKNKISEKSKINPVNPYAKSKYMIEQMIKDYSNSYKIKYLIFRFFNVGGADIANGLGENHEPETHLIPVLVQSCLSNKLFNIYGKDYNTSDGTCVRDYIHVHDLARAIGLGLKNINNEDYNLGSGLGYSVNGILNLVQKVCSKNIKWKINKRREGDPAKLIADSSKASKELNWTPEKTILNIIEDTYKWEKMK